MSPFGFADKEGIIQPSVFAFGRGLKLGRGLEIELGLAAGILAVGDNASVAHVDIYSVIGLNAVDSLQFGAPFVIG